MFTWFTREVAIFSFPTRPRSGKGKSGDLARGSNRVHFVIFPFPLHVTHRMVRLKLSYERYVSQIYIYLRTRRPKKSDSLLLAAQRHTQVFL